MLKRILAIAAALTFILALSVFTVHAEEDVTLYYYNSEGWDEVCVYTWEPSEQFGSWPGSPCTDEGDDWWSIVVPDYQLGNHIIFNNNNNGEQNNDLVLEEGKIYFYGSKSSEDGALTADEAVDMLGSLPGGAAEEEEPAEEEASAPEAPPEEPAAENPKTGEAPFLPISVIALVLAGGAAVFFNSRKQKV